MDKEQQKILIAKLRQLTGVGIMTCTKALTYSDWDYQKAVEYLRTHDTQPMCITIRYNPELGHGERFKPYNSERTG